VAAEILFPNWLMFECLRKFGQESPHTRIEWFETVLEGTTEALLAGKVDLAIVGAIPPGFAAERLLEVKFAPVAHPDHELHKLGRPVEFRDLKKHRHVVVRDSSSRRDKKARTLEASQRWTVSNMSTSIGAVSRGYGFAWLPLDKILFELRNGELKELEMRDSRDISQNLYLVYSDKDGAGPGVRRLAQILIEMTANMCREVRKLPEKEREAMIIAASRP